MSGALPEQAETGEPNLLSSLDLDYKPKLPRNKSRGIAIVGAGAIVQACHLPAYRMAGFNVVGIFDADAVKARKAAEDFAIPRVFASLAELLAHDGAEVVDIAIPAAYQPDIAVQAASAGKHILCQKPLAETYGEARRVAQAAEAAGVKGTVNQQMRWAPGIRASRSIVRRGWLGQLTQATIQVNVMTDFASWGWLAETERLELMYHSIHYMDAIRSIAGTPDYVYADGARFPGQRSKGETRSLIHMKYPGELRALIHDNHNNIASQDDWYATFRFEGTEGTVKGTNGALYQYPVGREDTLSFTSRRFMPGNWLTPQLEGKWFPHAFMGTMGELLSAIEEDREPENSLSDNLQTLQLLFAAYRSMEENRPVPLAEIAGT